ncbi:hypothetical protein OAJ22_01490 [Acidimicrobiaceae bacterium]|nr:hypothetical protein [Acidimicrobiaceae bacterium]
MLSKEAVKAKKKYSKLGTVIKLLVVDPKKIKMWKVKLQRLNFNLIGKNQSKVGWRSQGRTHSWWY